MGSGAKDSSGKDSRKKRSAARFFAVQALFQMEFSGEARDRTQSEFETHRIGADIGGETYPDADIDLFRRLLKIAVADQSRIDQMTDRALVAKWPIDRIDPTLRALFRAAGAELLGTKTPPKVVINEFVDVARAFFPTGNESKFVNGVLDHMAREAHPAAFT